MKKFLLFLSLLATVSVAFAQTQRGYVKTRGRLAANSTTIPGTRLSGATLTFKGNRTAVSGPNGVFTFSVPSKTFCVTNVQKNGYQLYDRDLLGKPHSYSSNDLLVVMDTPDNVLADKLASERKIRRTLQKQLMEKEDEIEALKAQQKITEEQYQKQLQVLYQSQENNEKLISEMAERYSTLDFDQLNDFQRRVAAFIQNGELTRADSLLNTKGSMEERSAELDRESSAIKDNAEELRKRQEEQAKSEALYAKKLEDFASDCYSRFEICKLRHDNDSAAYWLELRASKDTTNVEWLIEAGDFIWEFKLNSVASLQHYKLALNTIKVKFGEVNRDIARVYSKIGIIYSSQIRDSKSKEKALNYFHRALDIQDQILDSTHVDKLETYKGMAEVYKYQFKDTLAIEMLQKALEVAVINYGAISWEVADIYTEMGFVYNLFSNSGSSYLIQANTIREQLNQENDVHMVRAYLSRAVLNSKKSDLSIKELMKALSLLIQHYGENYPLVASVCQCMSGLYSYMSDYDNALLYAERGATICSRTLGANHEMTKSANALVNAILMKYEYDKESNPIDNESKVVKDIKSERVYTISILDSYNSESQQFMNGGDVVLEYSDWTIDSDKSLFVKDLNMIEMPKTILIIVDGVIIQRNIENALNKVIGFKKVGEEEKQRIIKAYHDWKEKQQ